MNVFSLRYRCIIHESCTTTQDLSLIWNSLPRGLRTLLTSVTNILKVKTLLNTYMFDQATERCGIYRRFRNTLTYSPTSRCWQILVHSCFNCVNCTQFGQLIFRKIIKMVASRCQILWLKLKSTKLDFRWVSLRPRPHTGGAYSALPDRLAWYKEGLLLILRGGK